MDILIIIVSVIVVIISIIVILYLYFNNEYKDIIYRIEEVSELLEETVKFKYDEVNKALSLIHKVDENIKNNIFDELVKLRSRRLSTFELDRRITDTYSVLIDIRDNNKDISDSKDIKKSLKKIKEYDLKLKTIHKYYDDSVYTYNNMLNKFPTNIIAKVNKYQEKELYNKKESNE